MSTGTRIGLALGLGGVVGLAALGYVVQQGRVAARQRQQDATDQLARVDAAVDAFIRCVAAAEPSEFGRGVREQLRTRAVEDLRKHWLACGRAYNESGSPTRNFSLLEYELDVCTEVRMLQTLRDVLLRELRLAAEPSTPIDCDGPLVDARGLDVSPDANTIEHDSGGLVIEHDQRHGWADPERGVVTWFSTSDPRFVSDMPLQVVGTQAYRIGTDLEGSVLGVWSDLSGAAERFETRRLDFETPSMFRATPERWFIVSESEGVVDIHFSDDGGESFSTSTTTLRSSAGLVASWAHASGKQLTLAFARDGVVEWLHVDAGGEVSTSELEHARVRGLELVACATTSGVLAVADGVLVHLDATPTLVKDLAPARVPALACVEDRAFVALDDGASLQRLVCDAAGCGDPGLLYATSEPEGAADRLDVALREHGGGVHVLIDGPLNFYMVDQPLGGELERIEGVNQRLSISRRPALVEGVLFPTPREAAFHPLDQGKP